MTEPPDKAHLRKHRDFLTAAYERAQVEFDKNLMALTGGALGVMLLVVKDITPAGQRPVWPWLFPVTCGLLAVSLGCALFALLASHRLFDREIAAVDRQLKDQPERRDIRADRERSRQRTRLLNYICFGTFLLGAVLMLVFAAANLMR